MKAFCEGCGGTATRMVRLTNGGLHLCDQCLDEINRKNPMVKTLQEELAAERKRCADLAWEMQMEQFGGGTAIGNAIMDGKYAERRK